MTRVGVSGAAGRMGRLVCHAIETANDLELVACYDPLRPDVEVEGIGVTDDPADVADAEAEVVVEFTTPDVVMGNLRTWRDLGVHAVIGTSGFDEARLTAVREQWGSGGSNCLIVPNFSIGAVLMMRFAALAAPHFAAAEIIEMHHDQKVDAPSGTSIATAAMMRESGGRQERQVEGTELVQGSRGAAAEGARVHSVRLPGLLAHQEVILGSDGEVLTIRHDSTDRVSFMPGVLLAVRSISGLAERVTVGLGGLLGL